MQLLFNRHPSLVFDHAASYILDASSISIKCGMSQEAARSYPGRPESRILKRLGFFYGIFCKFFF
jgi:hypothetical protein